MRLPSTRIGPGSAALDCERTASPPKRKRLQTARTGLRAAWSEELLDGVEPSVDHWKWTTLRARQFGFEIDAERLINRRHDIRGRLRAFRRISADLIALADDAPAFDSASGKSDRPDARPVIAPAGGIHFRRATEF